LMIGPVFICGLAVVAKNFIRSKPVNDARFIDVVG
jgi:hypothetical protein